jgi:hypothetical protein
MLLDARGHLKLTDLGLCKKIGDVSPHEEPEAILDLLRRQTISGISDGNEKESAINGSPNLDAKQRSENDISEDAPKRDAKTRREVRIPHYLEQFDLLTHKGGRWLTRQWVRRTT